ncbi:hypothetical protein LZ32DRAFT_630662 [Colletotrichum eremochloae]|nr:hypothetical protein LZ32DRAFT_630662 [Colletotrichum eremochloae]
MVPRIQKVTLASATGSVGSWALKASVADGFSVTVLARTQGYFPGEVTVKVIDFSSSDALEEAMRGQDAFRLTDAAAAAGVYRYIPSDFSLDFNSRIAHGFPYWNLRSGFMNTDIYGKKINYINDGDNFHVWTTLEAVGKAVSRTLLHYTGTVGFCKEALGSYGWKESWPDMEQTFTKTLKEFQAGNFGWDVFGGMLRYTNSKSHFSCH